MEFRGKLQSNDQVIASQDWVTLNLVENLVFSVRRRRLKTPGAPPPTHWDRCRLLPSTYLLHLSLSSDILIDSSTESPVHVLMLSIQAVHGLPRLRAPGIVPCIISFSGQLLCFLMVWPYASFLALTMSNSSLFTPALLGTHWLLSLLTKKPAESFSVLSFHVL